jgi:hypothetical protein
MLRASRVEEEREKEGAGECCRLVTTVVAGAQRVSRGRTRQAARAGIPSPASPLTNLTLRDGGPVMGRVKASFDQVVTEARCHHFQTIGGRNPRDSRSSIAICEAKAVRVLQWP